MMGIHKETSRRPRNRNQYQYVKSIGPGCWCTCPTVTQGGGWLSRKIPGAALWTSSARTAWRRRPRWIVCSSEPFLEEQNWRNRRERGLNCMEGDREPPTWISVRPTLLIMCSAMPGKGMSSWHEWWLEMSLGVITSNQNRNDKRLQWKHPGSPQPKNSKAIHTNAGKVMLTFFFKTAPWWYTSCSAGQQWIPSCTRRPWTPFAKGSNRNEPGKLTQRVILFHDSARPHTANTITAVFQKIIWEVLGLPPYSPDLSPCDYDIFVTVKKALRNKRFTSDDDFKQYVRNWFTTQLPEFYETAIHRLMSQWDKCLNSQGQYFWHTGTGFCS